VNTTTPSRVSARHRKHNWLWIGAEREPARRLERSPAAETGALIGAGAGAAAGTAGAAFTGKRQVTIPVESRVTFVLTIAGKHPRLEPPRAPFPSLFLALPCFLIYLSKYTWVCCR